MRKEIKVEAYRVYYECDDCNIYLKHTGIVIDTYPAIYPHECPKCHIKINLDNVYPIHISKEIK